ncbi:SusC/RagA family TonB-linked outer membrane protein [Polaribacter cellanae]|uniref:SusC/RagA family TonB-linked outer membrane protein n=1 Tax=Polaribacter cellanae TaxID=2818493 RepID=A0A975CR60_9FLAO|nr:SusC/RagA family TonB-linked outer membrane protein [Polaribacter cellanae]QTE24108.1 SusC/RagA family TonB-linked outer membrane protein [Polaribacter cellanae]
MKFNFNVILTLFLAFFVQISFAQRKTVTGTVSDKSGPLPGVSIIIKGSNKGTETDFDGKFTVNVKQGDVLVFRYLGMKTLEKEVGSSDTINVVLVENAQSLDEIVITTGYETIRKKRFTGASTTVKGADLKIDGVVDATRMLEGRVAGVSIQNVSGTFGAAPNITIRGASSVFGNNTPLYVIDGIVQEDIVDTTGLEALTNGDAQTLLSSSIAGINANDIKDVQILKDVSATALYGARARNGVVVITTKSGRKNAPLKVTYTLEQTLRDIPYYSNFDILNSKENMSILKELEAKGFLNPEDVAQSRYGGIYTTMEQRVNTFNGSGGFLLSNTPEARNRFLKQYELANTDWFRTLFRQSMTQNHSISLSGGGEKNTLYASLSFFTDPGWSIAENVKRLTSTIKDTYFLSDKFNVTFTTVASVRNQRAPGTFSRETDDFNGEVSRDFDINPFSYALNTSRTLRPRDENGNYEYNRNNWAPFNILEEIDNNYLDLDVKDIRFQLDANYKLNDHLTYSFNSAARYVNSTSEHQIRRNSNVVSAYNANETTIVRDANNFLYTDPDNPLLQPIPVFPRGGLFIKRNNYLTSYYIRNSINYDKTFENNHNLNVFLGQEMRYVDRNRDNFTGYGLQYNNGYTPFTDSRLLEKVLASGDNYFDVNQERERTVAFFGKATYSFNDKYILTLTGRFDGSNRQGVTSSSRWLPTGSVSAKWNANEEDFIKDSEIINNLAIRTSYGLTATPGNATNSLAIYRSQITDRLNLRDRENFLDIEALPNLDLTWEKQYELNIGFDLGLNNNAIQLSADYFKRDIFDNIDFIRTSGVGGQFIKEGNNSTMDIHGFELNLNTRNISTDDFSWSTNFNASYVNQKITDLQSQTNAFDLIDATGSNIVGFAPQSIFSFKFAGLNNRGYPTYDLGDLDPIKGLDFQETQNLATLLKHEGSVIPNIQGGFTNNFRYKNWNLNVLITGAGGNKIRLNPVFSSTYNDLSVFTKDFKNRWIIAGDEKITNIPTIVSSRDARNQDLVRAYNAYNYSTARIADGSFVRMKNVSLGYSFDKDVTDKLGITSLNVRLQGTNLFLIYADDKLNGQDPEFYQTGGVALPIRRQYTLSINLGM